MPNDVAEVKRQEVGEVSEAAGFLSVIERAARDPNVDIDKMERLLEMQERIIARNSRAAYASALAELQPALPVIAEKGEIKNRAGEVQSRYARWEDINQTIRPLLHAHGFSLSFRTGFETGRILVTGVLTHREGHAEETTISLPLDDSGSKNGVQGVGSSTSYGKRYTAIALLNITTGGEDDDGQKGGGQFITDEQSFELDLLIGHAKADKAAFLKMCGVERLEDLPATKFAGAKKRLEAKRDAQ